MPYFFNYIIFVNMFLRRYKPTSAGSRNKLLFPFSNLHRARFKPLISYLTSNGGRNSTGQITVRHKSLFHRHLTPQIDYHQNTFLCPFRLIGYFPSKKTTNLPGLIQYCNGAYSYVLTHNDCEINKIMSFDDLFIGANCRGLRLPLRLVPAGQTCFNAELKPGSGGKLARAGGTYLRIESVTHSSKTLVRLPSKKCVYLNSECLVTVGRSSNIFNRFQSYSKAGYSRYLGIRPTVRGEAMNPVDHPHGGQTRGGVPRRTPWGYHIK